MVFPNASKGPATGMQASGKRATTNATTDAIVSATTDAMINATTGAMVNAMIGALIGVWYDDQFKLLVVL